MRDDLTRLGVAELARLLRRREISPVELTERLLERTESLQPSLNAFMSVDREAALEAARRAERTFLEGRPAGLMHGIPYAAKDLIATRDLPTTMGSRLFETHRPYRDAVSVSRLRKAGAILIGKTTTSEFGHKPFTDGPLFGRTLNPFDPDVTCGGSSGGSAVAVATGQVPVALGTDGGGSVRIPAACCGIVGLKPTLGAVPHLDVPDLFAANSYVGPMARTVEDARILYDSICGFDSRDPYGQGRLPDRPGSKPIRELRIGRIENAGNAALDPECRDAASDAVSVLEREGAQVEPVEVDLAGFEEAFLVILQTALRSRLLEHWVDRRELLDPSLARTVELGGRFDASDLHRAGRERSRRFREIQSLFDRFDVLASPTLTAPPLSVDQDPHGPVTVGGESAGSIRGAWYPYTFPFNLTGHPAISVPCGRTASGLPLGVQFVAPWHCEALLFRLGAQVEKAAGAIVPPTEP